jgi:thioredoxin reductase
MQNPSSPELFDAAVVGGSFAGLSAALPLARARRKLLVVDAGQRRNRFVARSHGFLAQDGMPPGAIIDTARRQLMAYPNVSWMSGTVAQARQLSDGFELHLDSGEVRRASRLVLATGVVDHLPPIDGLAERWGQSVFHCPYCHGYELDCGRIGVLAVNEHSMHHALMLPDWGQVTLFLNDAFELSPEQRAALHEREVRIVTGQVRGIEEHATVRLEDGSSFVMDGLFSLTRTEVASPVAGQLGCAFDEGPLGRFIRTDETRQTTVRGVFACGDAARAAGNVALAVGDGALAGVGAHRSLLFPDAA